MGSADHLPTVPDKPRSVRRSWGRNDGTVPASHRQGSQLIDIGRRADPGAPWRYGTALPVACRMRDSAQRSGRSGSRVRVVWVFRPVDRSREQPTLSTTNGWNSR